MLKLVSDNLRTKKASKHKQKKLPFVIRYVLDRYEAQQICDKAILEKWWNFRICYWLLQKSTKCNKAVNSYPHAFKFVPDFYKTRKMGNKAVNAHPFTIKFVP